MSLDPCFLVCDKPAGVTSHDIVAFVRAVTGVRRVGHTGTLDPFATGVLPLALGSATKLIRFLDESEKVYDATIRLGASTTTGDPTGEVVREMPIPKLAPADVEEVLAGFVGEQMQRPPAYSAVKVNGRRMYEYARAGEQVEAEPRPIKIFSTELVELTADTVRVLFVCSRGTYARVLADEIATELGTAGHLEELCRPRSGPFGLEGALSMPRLSEIVAGTQDWNRALRPSRGPERVAWNARDEVVEALTPMAISPLQALSHLPLLPVSSGQAEAFFRSGDTPPPPPGVRMGERFLMVGDADLLAVLQASGGGKTKSMWRRPDH
jgi:tRNA pseudouridine55 synthase